MTDTRLLLDTNVWLDYFLDRSDMHDAARDLVIRALGRNVQLLAAISTVKDCYFLIAAELKRMERESSGAVSQAAAEAIREVSWSCITSMRKIAFIVPSDETDMIEAMMMRPLHPDFEDNLVVAAAMRAQADYLVTSDKQLLGRNLGYCLSVRDALAFVSGIDTNCDDRSVRRCGTRARSAPAHDDRARFAEPFPQKSPERLEIP